MHQRFDETNGTGTCEAMFRIEMLIETDVFAGARRRWT